MGEFLPYAGTNSVQEVVAGIHFQQSQERESAKDLIDAVKPELTEFQQFNPIHAVGLLMDMSSSGDGWLHLTPPGSPSGFEFSRVGHDGTPEQTIRYARGDLTARFTKYSGWENVLSASLRYLRGVVLEKKTDLDQKPVTSISLSFVDTYTYTGNRDESCAQLLFKSNAPHIAPHCFEAKGRWYSNTGWLETEMESGQTKNQLYIENRIAGESAVISIQHNGVFTLLSPRTSIPEIDSVEDPEAGLEEILNRLHAGNKSVLRSILLDDMLQRIGVEA